MDWLRSYLSVPLRQPSDCPRRFGPHDERHIDAAILDALIKRPGSTARTIARMVSGRHIVPRFLVRRITVRLMRLQEAGLIYCLGDRKRKWFVSSRVVAERAMGVR
jgi:hypothetical protein